MRTIKSIFLPAFILVFFSAKGQYQQCDISYRHYIGSLDGMELVMNLTITGGTLSGSCYRSNWPIRDDTAEEASLHLRLEGRIDEQGVATVEAFEGERRLGAFSGMADGQFRGTYRGKHPVKPPEEQSGEWGFRFTEDYEDGSIPLEGYCLVKDSALADSANSPFAHLEMHILLPPGENSFKALREDIIHEFLGNHFSAAIPDDSLLYYYAKQYFTNYAEVHRDIEITGASFNWESITGSRVLMNDGGILVYRTDAYAYTGGAHGMGMSRFLVYGMEEMKEISLQDIFHPGYHDDLSKLLEQQFRKDAFLGDGQPLTDAGLFENFIPPSENYFLTEKGIVFYYNPYSIAPYAMGARMISLGWDEIGHLLKENTPVARLASGH